MGRTKDKKYLLLQSQSTDTWETRCLDAATPRGAFRTVLPREKGHKYNVDHRDGLFYIRTNKGAKNFRLVTAPVADPSSANWKELIPHRPDVLLEAVELFKDFLVAHEQSEAVNGFRVYTSRRAPGATSPSPRRCIPRSEPERRSSSRGRSDSATSRWSRRRACTTMTWPRASGRCSSSRRCSAATTRNSTSPSACGRRHATG